MILYKKIYIFTIVIIFTFVFNKNIALAETKFEKISAESAILMEVTTGRILYEKNAEKPMRIASLTKIMTAILAIESCGNLNEKVIVSKNAVNEDGSSIYLKENDVITLNDLLFGLMLRSGNDAANVIAEHIGGTIENFVYMMNQKAKYLGMQKTKFCNPHGLDEKDNFSTAKDLAILTSYALQNKAFQQIVETKIKKVHFEGEDWDRVWINKNKMLTLYEGANGVKTGYTKLARRTLASSATKNGMQLVTIVLNAPDDWHDSQMLLDYGFNNYYMTQVIGKNDILAYLNDGENQIEVRAKDDFIYPLQKEEKKDLSIKTNLLKNYSSYVGTVEIYLHNTKIGERYLIKDIIKEKKSWYEIFGYFWGSIWR